MTSKSNKDIIVYQSADGTFKLDINIHDNTVWLSQQQIAELFKVDRSVITKHIKNILESRELIEDSVCAKIAHTASDNKTYQVNHYNLDMIISIGYRVNSIIATRFRQWATQTLKEYMIKGFAMDDERLKGRGRLGKDYFRELLERIRSIRASERRIYQQITDIFAECSIDYDPNSEMPLHGFFLSQRLQSYLVH